ncbi:High-affinity nicotinic acid transporter [Didymosphaeria variabile]|uniref:High-affinity nicotinic acid transporter n=1 Tax=Didymosphaeria variabile TaxID=1932322 RepID=A0A9W8XHR1_9PLEO|nr:High-affinity nicotinic acid transporter [Didymosphaeria variabile]KAJ4351465.1 High-affinity nicotinic acid transporter [Didymosphaeria variabile]
MADEKFNAEALAKPTSDDGSELPPPPSNYVYKLDLRLIPLLGCTYTLLFLDRTNIANARIEGLEKGLNMPSNGYNTCLWIFFIPFVLVEIPTNMIMGLPRVKPNLFLGGSMLVLGVISMCQGLTHTYGGLLACRFLMGILEATLPAGAALLLSEYYTRKEQPLRFAMFFTFGVLGPLVSGLLAYGIRRMNGVQGKEGWRWIFIIEGLATIAISFLVFLYVPNFPEKTNILSGADKEHLLEKLRRDKGDQKLSMKSVNWLAVLSDWKIWLPTMMFFCCDMTAASIVSFTPTILTELGWKAERAQVMSIPIWVTGFVFELGAGYLSSRTGWRFPFILFGITLATIGWIIQIVYSESKGLAPGVRYFSLFAMSAGTFLQMAMTMSWMTNNLRGRASVAVGTAMILGLGNCANFVASNVFIKGEAPFYPTGFRTGLGITVAGAAFCVMHVALLWWHNQKLSRKRAEVGGEDDQREYRYQY